ncbi:hypothetical protein Tco_1193398 [Tanacetum coccineum]
MARRIERSLKVRLMSSTKSSLLGDGGFGEADLVICFLELVHDEGDGFGFGMSRTSIEIIWICYKVDCEMMAEMYLVEKVLRELVSSKGLVDMALSGDYIFLFGCGMARADCFFKNPSC